MELTRDTEIRRDYLSLEEKALVPLDLKRQSKNGLYMGQVGGRAVNKRPGSPNKEGCSPEQ